MDVPGREGEKLPFFGGLRAGGKDSRCYRRTSDTAIGIENLGSPALDQFLPYFRFFEDAMAQLVGVEDNGSAAGQRSGDRRFSTRDPAG